MESKYYIYIYLDPRISGTFTYADLTFEYEPFYVGKGSNGRYKEHLNEAYNIHKSSHKCNLIRKIKHETGSDPIILKIEENLLETDAFDLEVEYISKIGRRCVNEGPLTNKLEGGQCGLGSGKMHPLYGTSRPQSVKDKISESLKGRSLTDETKDKLRKCMSGIPKSKEHCKNISNGKKGIATVHHDDATRKKIGNSLRGIKHHSSRHIIFITPDGEELHIYSNFQNFIKDHNLSLRTIKTHINKGKIPEPKARAGIPRHNTTGWEVSTP